MNIITIFFYTILAKYSPKCTKIAPFKKFSQGSIPPNHDSKRVRHANTPTFPKIF